MIFLTGASGLIGSFILSKLIHEGKNVTVLINETELPMWLIKPEEKLTVIKGNLKEFTKYDHWLKDIKTIIHAAGKVSFDPREKAAIFRINHGVTRDLINSALRNKVEEFLHIGSVASLGFSEKENMKVSEGNDFKINDITTDYAISKYEAEMDVWRGGAEGLKVSILNPAVVLGPTDWESSSTRIFNYVRKKRKFYPKGKMAYVDVRDVAQAVSNILKQQLWGHQFILAKESIAYKELLDQIAKTMHIVAPNIAINKYFMLMASNISLLLSMMFKKTIFLPPQVVKMTFRNVLYDSTKSEKVLSLKYRTLQETLDFTIQKLKENY